jgi:diguanylate cyclase (GGDEF)-like protein
LKSRAVARSAAAATSVAAVCVATLLLHDWKAALLAAVPIAGMFITYRAYQHERQRRERLEFLYEAVQALSDSPEIGVALEKLLAQAVDTFRAEVAEIIFFAPESHDALRATIRAGGRCGALEGVEPDVAERLHPLIARQQLGARATWGVSDGPLTEYLRSRELGDGMFAALKGQRCIGAMVIGTPSRDDSFSPEDLRLFETLANNTSVALENDRLGQAVWQMKELQRELRHQASHDPLTDLANRSLFQERVGNALQRSAATASVIFIDIDDFKAVNDSLGHAAGDELLVAVARRLHDCVRPSDLVARLGGDEFAILLGRSGSAEEAIEVAKRVIQRVAERFAIVGHNISVRASAGIATGDRARVDPEELIRNADVAMYRAKQAGKHGYVVFEPGMEVSVPKSHGVRQRLRNAVREESFVVPAAAG